MQLYQLLQMLQMKFSLYSYSDSTEFHLLLLLFRHIQALKQPHF
ncbi:hypothetical protein MtrunA17_Chr6g0471191 [Medicago truncatula]|uniref:Uncharacterized protein n=1 Tax=Medicago truncatula TaxID=3880 RepID=A0A396HGF5_MEDTR|nr:hypothetical protein MtrunA17_Chr6g0471191 [Medicago truncatula]